MELDGYFEILIMYMYLQNENGLNLKKKLFYFFHIYEFFFNITSDPIFVIFGP